MIPADNAAVALSRAGVSDQAFCPECGQPLTLARTDSHQRSAASWRSSFLVTVGLYLAIIFGLNAWHAFQRIRDANACPSAETRKDCVAQPREVGSPVASRNVATGEAFAVGIAEVDLARNVRYASVGLVGLVVGLAALLVRLKRDRRRGRSFGVDF